ncbi:MAG: hypothetical protein AAF909_12325 [Pseudomonadota bacterium]
MRIAAFGASLGVTLLLLTIVSTPLAAEPSRGDAPDVQADDPQVAPSIETVAYLFRGEPQHWLAAAESLGAAELLQAYRPENSGGENVFLRGDIEGFPYVVFLEFCDPACKRVSFNLHVDEPDLDAEAINRWNFERRTAGVIENDNGVLLWKFEQVTEAPPTLLGAHVMFKILLEAHQNLHGDAITEAAHSLVDAQGLRSPPHLLGINLLKMGDPETALAFLRAKGPAELNSADPAWPMIIAEIDGVRTFIAFYGCGSALTAPECSTLAFVTILKSPCGPIGADRVAQLNQRTRYGGLVIDPADPDEVILGLDWVVAGGVHRQMADGYFGLWRSLLRQHRAIAEGSLCG